MTTNMNYYLGVKTIQDAANALNKLSFMKIIDASTLTVEVANSDRIVFRAGPASKDDDLSKGLMLWIGGSF